ncbi:hypothetical protein [Schlesneria paludicola]|uniref:hypothetical protein n=1 Tax=Schlesneria paludicola TaxID=360056 RepID=UPI00029A41F3|nr:hypothetical protein [Schlesneria paludicola]
MNNIHIKQAPVLWATGKPFDAGRIIFEGLPTESRPKWASRILKFLLRRYRIESPQFDYVLKMVDNKDLWSTGHQAFCNLRDTTLRLDEAGQKREFSEEESLLIAILAIAELVCKVTYNATSPIDEFDEDSGWWIVHCLRGFVDYAVENKEEGNESFSHDAWIAISAPLD